MNNILDKVEKIGKLHTTEKEDFDNETGLLLILTFKNNEQEIFHIEREAAVHSVECMIDKILDKEWGPFVLHNNFERTGFVGKIDRVKDFRGMVMIDENIRTIRLIDPNDIPGKED